MTLHDEGGRIIASQPIFVNVFYSRMPPDVIRDARRLQASPQRF